MGKRVIKIAAAALIFILALLSLLPWEGRVALAGSELCVWESGPRRESRAELFRTLVGTDGSELLFERDGERGSLPAGEECRRVFSVLSQGGLAELLALRMEEVSDLERTALFLQFGDTGYYADEFFAFDGTQVSRSSRVGFGRVVLLAGSISAQTLILSGARELGIRAEAELSPSSLAGTQVKRLFAEEPYFTDGSVLFLHTAGGVRLSALLPCEEPSLSGYDFADEGALSSCLGATSLRLPFLGSGRRLSTDFSGSLLYLFGEAPKSLKRVKAEGGCVIPFAFAGCSALEEIDLCGVPEGDISQSAFYGLPSLRLLHTRKEFDFEGFARTTAPCGCYEYRRIM